MKKNHLAAVRKERRAKEEKIRVVSSLKEALGRIDELEAHVRAVTSLKASQRAISIRPQEGKNTSEAVAVAIATDWHIGSMIRPEQVNGLNRYDVATARQRATKFFQNVVKLVDKERQNVKISELVLFLGGDLIDGALHMDTIMSNEITEPIKQAIVCQELLEAGLNFLLNHGKFKQITCVCCDGNHGRITTKLHFSSRQGNALEYFMYYTLAHRFPQIRWQFADGLLAYLKIYDYTVRFHHGDTIHFGGINGPYTYLNRRIQEWDKAVRADYSVQGHLHQYILGSRRWLINGSLVGYSPFAMGLGGEYQPPIQAFWLLDKKRGVTVQIPILV
jgi:hypothetical protein